MSQQPDVNVQPQTECQVYVEEWHQDGNITLRREFLNTIGFTYSNDVLNLGDPFAFSVANPAGRYNDHFQRGARVRFYLKNPSVNGGQSTLKHDGIVTNRGQRCDRSGCYLDVQCADLGWHLANNDAPLWYVLQGGRLIDLLQDKKFIDPSWGLKGVVSDYQTSVLMRRGLNNSRAQAQIDLQALGTTVHIQVEPGDKVCDLILNYCRRIGRLFTVSPDGYMQVWKAGGESLLFSINFHGFEDGARSLNNVIDVHISEDIGTIFTVVTCIGEIVGGNLQQDTTNQNAAKRAGTFRNSMALPFRHNLNFADGEVFNSKNAAQQALWRYNRGIYDSWTYMATVRGHHQAGNWWEPGTLCAVNDTVNGVVGTLYVSAVTYTRDERGDTTQVTLKKPDLLQASYGVYSRPPRVSAPTTLPMAATQTQTDTATSSATVTTTTQAK